MRKAEEKAAALDPGERSSLRGIRVKRIVVMIVACILVAFVVLFAAFVISLNGDMKRIHAEHLVFDRDRDEHPELFEEADRLMSNYNTMSLIAAALLYAWIPLEILTAVLVYLRFKCKYPYYSGSVYRVVKRQERQKKRQERREK